MLHETKRSMNNFLLYCKGWYMSTKSRDQWKELNKICNMDGYGPGDEYLRSWGDLLEILLNHFEELNLLCKINNERYLTTTDFVRRVGERIRLTNMSYEKCVAMTIISFVQGIPARGFIKMDPPKYSRRLSRYGFTFPWFDKKGMTYTEANKQATEQLKDH